MKKEIIAGGLFFLIYSLLSFSLLALVSFVYFHFVLAPSSTGQVSFPFLNQGFPVIYSVLHYGVFIFACWLTALSILRLFKSPNIFEVAKIAVICYGVLNLLFLIRDLLIRDINGIPIKRNYIHSITSDLTTLFLFYIFSLILLNYYQRRKTKLPDRT